MKSTRYPAGSFLEIDDLKGGRKVVMVAKDGVTYLESTQAGSPLTPVAIHPVLHVEELGALGAFAMRRGLTAALRKLIEVMRERFDTRLDHDPLYVMRLLWALGRGAEPGYVPDAAAIDRACQVAAAQEQASVQLHFYAERYAAALAAG